MSVEKLVPIVWSTSILRNFEKSSVYAHCLSRTYEGEIKSQGDTVRVPIIGPVAVRPYVKGTPISYDDVSASTLDIVIDQATYWALKCEDIDKTQSAPAFLDAATKNAAYALKDTVDVYVAGILDAGAGTVLGATVPVGSMDYLHLFTAVGQKLDELNVPRAGRWIVIPPFVAAAIAEKIMAMQTPNPAVIADGWVGRTHGFDILVSNNLPKNASGNYSVLAGTSDCGTFITQIIETESLRDSQQFGDLVRGLAVYTSKVLLPAALVKAIVAPPEEKIT